MEEAQFQLLCEIKARAPTGGSVLERSSRSWLQELKHRKLGSEGGWVVCGKCPCQGVIQVSSHLSFGDV